MISKLWRFYLPSMPTLHPKFRAAAIQAAPVFLDLDRSIDKAIGLIGESARNGARLVAFPETWLPGYPWFTWLDSPAWGMQFIQRYHDNSLTYGTPEAARVAKAARDNRIYVVMGLSEKAGGSLYMGQWIIGAEGNTVATRRKLKPTHVERTIFGEGDGSHLAVHDTPLGRLGSMCCWEHLQPLSKYAMYAQNEQIHVAAWPSFSLYRGAAYALGPELNMLRPGGGFTRIYGPDGSSLAEPIPEDQEGILYADLDLAMIPLAKAAADPSGHYSRPDVTRLMLNQTPGERVIQFTMPGMVLAEGSSATVEQSTVAAERGTASAAKTATGKH